MNISNRSIDIILSTQLCFVVAAMCVWTAHQIEIGVWLNPGWFFAIPILMFISIVLMLLPYILTAITEKQEKKWQDYLASLEPF